MAIINCPECGQPVSDRADKCIHCGFPLRTETSRERAFSNNEKSVAIVYGLQQTFLIGGTVKLYIDGEYIASVKKGDSVEIPVTRNCTLTAKCGLNPFKGKKELRVGKTSKIQIVYDRLLGTFMMQDIHN